MRLLTKFVKTLGRFKKPRNAYVIYEWSRRKRAPLEAAATSLQAMLAKHRIDTNVLKTRSQIRPEVPKINAPSMLTPSQRKGQRYQGSRRPGGLTTQNQRPLPQNFYTNSDIFPQFNKPASSETGNGNTQVASEKQDSGFEVEPKTTSFRETAVIALKLSQSIMTLYKTVSPYFN